LLGFNKLSIKNIDLNTKEKQIKIDETKLKYLYINTKRYKNSSLNIDNLVISKDHKKKTRKAKKAYEIKLDRFIMQDAKISFKDGIAKPSIQTRLTNINKIKLECVNKDNLEMYDNDCYKLYGLPFFNDDLKDEFDTEFQKLILS